MKRLSITLAALFSFFITSGQDTFSIVAVDPETGEVGSAGASCVDLIEYDIENAGFLGVLIPGLGAINSQSYYDSTNQANATLRLLDGMTPEEIVEWLDQNDVDTTPGLRQYGIAAFVNGEPMSAGYTGVDNMDYKNHITGETFSIQGNILSGQEVLDSMEVRFNRTEGSLAEKLMAALEGAQMVGADSRCAENGTSSLFAFIKVAQPDDEVGSPSFYLDVKTSNGDRVEPIAELRSKFDEHQRKQ